MSSTHVTVGDAVVGVDVVGLLLSEALGEIETAPDGEPVLSLLGIAVGFMLGLPVGDNEEEALGTELNEGSTDGAALIDGETLTVGTTLCIDDGELDVAALGADVGSSVGEKVGLLVGLLVGSPVGEEVGVQVSRQSRQLFFNVDSVNSRAPIKK